MFGGNDSFAMPFAVFIESPIILGTIAVCLKFLAIYPFLIMTLPPALQVTLELTHGGLVGNKHLVFVKPHKVLRGLLEASRAQVLGLAFGVLDRHSIGVVEVKYIHAVSSNSSSKLIVLFYFTICLVADF